MRASLGVGTLRKRWMNTHSPPILKNCTAIQPVRKSQVNSGFTGEKKVAGAASTKAPTPPTCINARGTTNSTDTASTINCRASEIITAHSPPATV